MKEGVRHEIQKLEDSGIISPMDSPWAAPIVPVPKPGGSVRLFDFRRLNAGTESDPYYMITLDEIFREDWE